MEEVPGKGGRLLFPREKSNLTPFPLSATSGTDSYMERQNTNVTLLACCQALLLTGSVTLISIGALAGYALAPDKRLATLPAATYVLGALVGTMPASIWMRRVGRRNGFLAGGAFGLAGSTVATFAM